MRRLIFLSLAVFICLPMAVYAASIGGAETQGQGKIAVGVDQTFVFNRDLKFKSASGLGTGQTLKNVKVDREYETMLKTSYGLLDNLDVYFKLGSENSRGKGDNYVGDSKYGDDKSKTGAVFAYGFGLKGVYELQSNWLIGCDLQYLRSSHETRISETVVATGESDATKYKSVVSHEWHVAPYIAKRINNFTPYLGVKYSDSRDTLKKPADDGWLDNVKYEADDNVGVFVGTDYKIGDHWKLNLEGRFVDETAMSVGATYRF